MDHPGQGVRSLPASPFSREREGVSTAPWRWSGGGWQGRVWESGKESRALRGWPAGSPRGNPPPRKGSRDGPCGVLSWLCQPLPTLPGSGEAGKQATVIQGTRAPRCGRAAECSVAAAPGLPPCLPAGPRSGLPKPRTGHCLTWSMAGLTSRPGSWRDLGPLSSR